jgi:hypothetical protein
VGIGSEMVSESLAADHFAEISGSIEAAQKFLVLRVAFFRQFPIS